jgi:hypothetical protein
VRRIPIGFYFTLAALFAEGFLQVSGIQSPLLAYGFAIGAGVSFLIGCIQSVVRIKDWLKNTRRENLRLGNENERLTKVVEQRDKNIHALRQGYEELAAKVTDPTANRQREERMARERCTEVAQELTTFWQSHQRTDSQEFIAIFQKRQEWKVNELRERLEKQGLLTTQERDILTFRSGDDLKKIEQIIFLLRKIGEGG